MDVVSLQVRPPAAAVVCEMPVHVRALPLCQLQTCVAGHKAYWLDSTLLTRFAKVLLDKIKGGFQCFMRGKKKQ